MAQECTQWVLGPRLNQPLKTPFSRHAPGLGSPVNSVSEEGDGVGLNCDEVCALQDMECEDKMFYQSTSGQGATSQSAFDNHVNHEPVLEGYK